MAVAEYRDGLDFGVGVASLNGSLKGDAVLCTNLQESIGAPRQDILFMPRQIEALEELESELGTSTEIGASFGSFSGGGRFSLIEKSKFPSFVSTSALVIPVSVIFLICSSTKEFPTHAGVH